MIKEYSFDILDIDEYEISDTLFIESFKPKYKIDLEKTRQKSLNNGSSYPLSKDNNQLTYWDYNFNKEYKKQIIVRYKFKDKLIIRNEEFDALHYGLDFDYENLFGYENIGYEWYTIDGVLFNIKEK